MRFWNGRSAWLADGFPYGKRSATLSVILPSKGWRQDWEGEAPAELESCQDAAQQELRHPGYRV